MSTGYREFPAPLGVRHLVGCLWEQVPERAHEQRVVPDGCVDLIFLAEGELVIAGADTGPRVVALPAGRRSTGLRLRPGAAGAVLGFPASELCDREVEAEAAWGARARELRDRLIATELGERRALLAGVVDACAERDALVVAAAGRLDRPGRSVAAVAAELGVSERTLHRRTVAAVGYGPKVLARVARLRRLVALADGPLARRALEAGYAGQAHMSDEVRRLTGMTPVRFLEDATLTAA
ncbi:MAG: helix-turn-helix domain-containing protein [Actinobacteria bacterium]|nr:helix-turn-helix domain-containing protein [Actinomycetota bacterium]